MKRGSVGAQNQKQTSKKPKTNAEIAQKLLGNIEQGMMKQLTLGKVMVSSQPKPLPQPKKTQPPNFSNPQQYLQSIETSLKALRSSIQQSKRVQKQQQRAKKLKAKELIDRMKKEKEEHQLKIREHSEKNMLSSRIYSESTINKMRQKLEERITQKKREIEERVKSIEQRKKVRDEKYVNQQIQYWQKVKDIKQKSKSTPKLPRIGSLDLSSKVNPSSIRKNTSFITSSEPVQSEQPQKGLQHYLKIAKSRQQHLKLKLVQQRNQTRLQKIINSNSNLASRLQKSHSSKVVEVIPFNANKHKLMGDQFLKESLLLIKKNQSIPPIQPEQPQQKVSIEIQAHQATISKNQKIQKIRQKWQRTLSKIQHNEINMQQGLDLLNNIEKRLDKIDLNGIKERLKKKYEIFQKMPQLLGNNKEITIEVHQQAQGKRKE